MNSLYKTTFSVGAKRPPILHADVGSEPDAAKRLATLIGRCALRDQQAFLALYDATSAKLFGVILRIVKRERWAEGVLQDKYLEAWHAPES